MQQSAYLTIIWKIIYSTYMAIFGLITSKKKQSNKKMTKTLMKAKKKSKKKAKTCEFC